MNKEKLDERGLPSFFADAYGQLPFEIKARLEEVDAKQLIASLNESRGYPHNEFHTHEVLHVADVMLPFIGVGPNDAKRLKDSIRLHDLGYKLVDVGLLNPKDHNWGSLFMAKMFTEDNLILSAILHHSQDVLPKDTPLWARLLRDFDRMTLFGYSGMIRKTTFWGFDHPDFHRPVEELVDEGNLCDFRHPMETGYGEKPKLFFYKHVFPFIIKNGLIRKSLYYGRRLEAVVLGGRPNAPYYIDGGLREEDDIVTAYKEWVVEPVLGRIQRIFYKKEYEYSGIMTSIRKIHHKDMGWMNNVDSDYEKSISR